MGGISKKDRDLWLRYVNGPTVFRMPATGPFRPRPVIRTGRSLDLHGMTLQDAWKSVKAFVERHHDRGTKEIVIICGKGGEIARELPFWCQNMASIRCINPIIDRQGQHGAFRIRLRPKK